MKYEDTRSYKTYMAIGGTTNFLYKFLGNFRAMHMAYQAPGFFHGFGNLGFAFFLCVSVVGIPVVVMMLITFNKYHAKKPFFIYLLPLILLPLLFGCQLLLK